MHVWLNGKFVERDSATVPVFDAGLQHGIGLFETCGARHGTVFRADAHARRLVNSARELLLNESLRPQPLVEAMELVVRRNGLDEARVRLTVTGGNLGMLRSVRRVDPTILIDAQPPTRYPEEFFAHGVMVTIAGGRVNPMSPMAGHKTLDYWPRIHALQHAAAKKGGEALWFTVAGHLASGSVSNVFLVKDTALMTPAARGEDPDAAYGPPVLPGITRAAVLELAEEIGLEASRARLTIDDLLAADEVFLTNSSWGILPVTAVERETVGEGDVGETTGRLREAWLELVEKETSTGVGP